MARYHFTTFMRVTAPRDRVWEVISRPETYAGFWKWLKRVDVLDHGEEDGVGARYRLVFGTALPYTLEFDTEVVRREPPQLLESRADGELRGTGRWVLTDGDDATDVTYEWLVETTKRWMNILAPIARPAFSWNHDVLMKDFAKGLSNATESSLVEVVNSTTRPGQAGFYELPPT